MKYIDVLWHSTDPSDPYRMVSEIDDLNYEVRKVEYFRDGSVSFADAENWTDRCMLGECEVPPLAEINAYKEFEGAEITADEFEKLWASRFDGPNPAFQPTPGGAAEF